MGDLSEHFSRWEFACRGENCCGHSAPVSVLLINTLEALREYVRSPLTISSGFRCNIHNAAVSLHEHSHHTYGEAADVLCPRGRGLESFVAAARMVGFKGIGAYYDPPERIHVDVRTGPVAYVVMPHKMYDDNHNNAPAMSTGEASYILEKMKDIRTQYTFSGNGAEFADWAIEWVALMVGQETLDRLQSRAIRNVYQGLLRFVEN